MIGQLEFQYTLIVFHQRTPSSLHRCDEHTEHLFYLFVGYGHILVEERDRGAGHTVALKMVGAQ